MERDCHRDTYLSHILVCFWALQIHKKVCSIPNECKWALLKQWRTANKKLTQGSHVCTIRKGSLFSKKLFFSTLKNLIFQFPLKFWHNLLFIYITKSVPKFKLQWKFLLLRWTFVTELKNEILKVKSWSIFQIKLPSSDSQKVLLCFLFHSQFQNPYKLNTDMKNSIRRWAEDFFVYLQLSKIYSDNLVM